MIKTTATKLFAQANIDTTYAIKRAKQQKVRLASIKADLKLFINVLRPVLNDNDHMSIVNGSDKPVLYINMRDLDSFKTGRVIDTLKVLEAFGTADKTEDWASLVNRDYHYSMGKYDVRLCAYVREDSPTCRKVVVGSETQTVVKYEIQCD